jgi:hypothetical protein
LRACDLVGEGPASIQFFVAGRAYRGTEILRPPGQPDKTGM